MEAEIKCIKCGANGRMLFDGVTMICQFECNCHIIDGKITIIENQNKDNAAT